MKCPPRLVFLPSAPQASSLPSMSTAYPQPLQSGRPCPAPRRPTETPTLPYPSRPSPPFLLRRVRPGFMLQPSRRDVPLGHPQPGPDAAPRDSFHLPHVLGRVTPTFRAPPAALPLLLSGGGLPRPPPASGIPVRGGLGRPPRWDMATALAKLTKWHYFPRLRRMRAATPPRAIKARVAGSGVGEGRSCWAERPPSMTDAGIHFGP